MQPSPWWLNSTPNISNGSAIFRSGVPIGGESKPRLRIDEPANEPRRCHAIDTGAWSSNPQPPLIPLGSRSALQPSPPPRGTALPDACVLEPRQERRHAVAAGAPEEIDAARSRSAVLERRPRGVESPARACRVAVECSPRASGPSRCRAPTPRRRPDAIAETPRSSSSSDQASTLSAANTLASPPAALTSVFSHSKSSRASGSVGQRIHRLLDRDGPELLQSAPGAHAQVRWTRGQLVNEQQPSSRRACASERPMWRSAQLWDVRSSRGHHAIPV